MSSSARLKYKIVKCTSEDPEYPASELLTHSSQTKGWQTARFCEFPQEIGLQFETPVHLRQVQFLSHQSKIATKIELFTASPVEGQNGRYDTAQFKRLGYLSLDSNERSQFQARELKSVYVDVSAQFLKIVLHKCHVNRYNIVNQIGLIALHCSGDVLGPDLAVGPPPPNPMLARNNVPDNSAYSQGQRAPPLGGGSALPQQQLAAQKGFEAAQEAAKEAAQAASDEMRYDSHTLERIRSLTNAKQRAVEAEDYEEAKRCKEMLTRLRQAGQMLRELEDKKRKAVQGEDYDAAKALKVEIERLRQSIDERPPPEQRNFSALPAEQPFSGDGRQSPDWAPVAQSAPPRGGHLPAMSQGPGSGGGLGYDSSDGGFGGGQRSASAQSPAGSAPRDAMFGADAGGSSAPPPWASDPPGDRSGGSMPLISDYDEQASMGLDPSMGLEGGGGIGSGNLHGAPQSPALMGNVAGSMGGLSPSGGAPAPQALERERSTPSEAAQHLRGVPNVEDILTSPEALAPGVEKDKEVALLVELFGDYIARCIFSKTWSLRDAALQKLAIDLRDGARDDDDPGQLLKAYASILKRTIADKNVQVSLSSGVLLQAVCHVLLRESPVPRNEVQAMVEPLMPLLVDRLGEPNARVDKTARDALLEFGRSRSVGTNFTAPFLLKMPKKKTVAARVFSSRLHVLTALASEFGVQPESRDGVPLESTVQLAMESFNNKDGEVRENAVKLVAACYIHIGLPRIESHLVNLRPAQREIFDAEFERSAFQGGGAAVGRTQGGLPSPSVPPRRQAAAASSSSQQEEAIEGGEELETEEFTCQFCGREDPSFAGEALDVHYWRDCAMLSQCEFCQQVIEISTLRHHLCEECESGAPAQEKGFAMLPEQCPLCLADVGQAEDQDWQDHLLTAGCPSNPRNKMPQ